MIDIRYSQNAAAWWEYYLAHPGLTDAERKGVWLGGACEALGWKTGAAVTGEQFACLLDGYSIDRVSCVQRRLPSRRCGYDLVVSAPKSVSIAALCWNDEQGRAEVQRAFSASAMKLGSICEELVKRQGQAPFRQRTGNMAAAVFNHHVSRYGDPHLHSHLVIGNLTMLGQKWAAIALDTIYRAKRALDRLFMADLMSRLSRAGILASLSDGHCLLPVPKELSRRLSNGRKKLEQAADKLGLHGRRRSALMAVLNDRLRPKKRLARMPFTDLPTMEEQEALGKLRRRRAAVNGSMEVGEVVVALRAAVLSEGAPTEKNRISAASKVAQDHPGTPIELLVGTALSGGLLHGDGLKNQWAARRRRRQELSEESQTIQREEVSNVALGLGV